MSASKSETLANEVIDTIVPLVGELELWCHRTRITKVGTFWEGLRIPALQAGLRSTATMLTKKDEFPSLEDAIEEFAERHIPEDPMNNTRIFAVTPSEHRELLMPFDSGVPFKKMGLLPGRFVLAHLCLLESKLHINPDFNPTTKP